MESHRKNPSHLRRNATATKKYENKNYVSDVADNTRCLDPESPSATGIYDVKWRVADFKVAQGSAVPGTGPALAMRIPMCEGSPSTHRDDA